MHRFSNETMPLINILWNSTGYWILFGIFTMYYLLDPRLKDEASHTKDILSAVFFTVFELLNLKCHMVLKNLRKPGTRERGIPRGFGFDQVSCANYLWEFSSWVAFAFLAEVWGAWVFAACSFYQMFVWALKKHKRYHKEFPDYPRSRKVMIPFLL